MFSYQVTKVASKSEKSHCLLKMNGRFHLGHFEQLTVTVAAVVMLELLKGRTQFKQTCFYAHRQQFPQMKHLGYIPINPIKV